FPPLGRDPRRRRTHHAGQPQCPPRRPRQLDRVAVVAHGARDRRAGRPPRRNRGTVDRARLRRATGHHRGGDRLRPHPRTGPGRPCPSRAPHPPLDYPTAATAALQEYLASLDPSALGEVIASDWDPPVTRGTRLVSIIDDAAQHAGQVGYALSIAPG